MTDTNPYKKLWKFKKVRYPIIVLGVLLILVIASFSVIKFVTPDRFANPKPDHLHFRMQYVFRGQAENFGSPRYQVDYLKDVCSGALTDSPIHFHDNKDQIVHLHWRYMTGGDVLKFYGVDKVGGLDDYMGFKTDKLLQFPPTITPVPIHSQSLPDAAGEDKYFVYIGEKDKFEKKDFNQFLNQNLEDFLGKNSTVREQYEESEKQKKTSFVDLFSPIAAQAHAGVEHSTLSEAQQHEIDVKKAEAEKKAIEDRNNQVKNTSSSSSTTTTGANDKTEEELKEINNLIGNVVIFVQPNEPTNEQIQARFNNLEPLGLSACGG